MAHAPLLRHGTAPIFPAHTSEVGDRSRSMSSTPRASQLSGSTAYASSSSSLATLNSDTTVMPNGGGPVIATGNIINQKADASRSLYQICISLKQRLAQVPGFEPFLQQLDPNDPVDPLWNLFRTGYPLLAIYNALQPSDPLTVDDPNASESKKSKIAVFKFVQACMKELQLATTDSFVIADLMGEDTGGFVKVTQVVNYVLDLAEARGLLLQSQPFPEDEAVSAVKTSQMTYRDHIVKELVDTERKYVQDLENLHDLKTTLDQKGVIPGDIVHQIFLNIKGILDFQRRFLIRVETTNSMSTETQRWGQPFCVAEKGFDVYQPFIANQRKAAQLANQVFDMIQQSEHPVAADFNTLDGFLLKPMQRLVKYPLLLKDLHKKTEDEETKEDLMAGWEAAERVLTKANEAVNRDLLDEALKELMGRVDDWKSHKVEQFGRLLLHGVYGVITGKSDQEKDYEIYLFECILLCCKEIMANKSKDKKDRTRSQGPKTRNKSAKLQLKGRIFMTNVTDVISLSKPGSHSVQIWWKGDTGVENFTIKFLNEEIMKKWAAGLEMQRKENVPRLSDSSDGNAPEFAWTRDQNAGLENPYLGQDDDDDDDYGPATAPVSYPVPIQQQQQQQQQQGMGGGGGGGIPRTLSSSNLKQRFAAEGSQSLASIARAPPSRFPMPMAGPPAGPLSLQTHSGAPSPNFRNGDSYFSPTGDSPASSRTSGTSVLSPANGYPFPKVATPQPPWDEHNRYTAPAAPRAPSRDGTPPNGYGMNGRNPRGPSLPAMATQAHGNNMQQQRSRSYSTPDVNAQGQRRKPSQGNVPAVPGIPAHLHQAPTQHEGIIARSRSGSPRNEQTSGGQDLVVQPQRLHKHSGSLGGTMSTYPGQPLYQRQNMPQSGATNGLRVDTVTANSRAVSPALGTGALQAQHPAGQYQLNSTDSTSLLANQLKVRVTCDTGNYVTLVVGFHITYQSLVDRIDGKLARFTNSSISRSMLKLRYRDEDGDFVTIESDDDIQIAFQEWRDGIRNMYAGGVGEIELFCVGETA